MQDVHKFIVHCLLPRCLCAGVRRSKAKRLW